MRRKRRRVNPPKDPVRRALDERLDDAWHAHRWHDGYDEPLPIDQCIELLGDQHEPVPPARLLLAAVEHEMAGDRDPKPIGIDGSAVMASTIVRTLSKGGFGRVYERHFLRSLRRKAHAKLARYPDLPVHGIPLDLLQSQEPRLRGVMTS